MRWTSNSAESPLQLVARASKMLKMCAKNSGRDEFSGVETTVVRRSNAIIKVAETVDRVLSR